MADDKINEAVENAGVVIADLAAVHAAADRLAGLDRTEYDLVRKAEAKRLGIRAGTLDAEVDKRRPIDDDTGSGAGTTITLHDPEPWPEPVNGAVLLDDLAAAFRRYLVLPNHSPEMLALWAMHTHCFEAFQHTPRLSITSPEKGCGKTVLLDVLEQLVPRGIRTENVSTAVLFRLVDAQKPTLLVDEADSFLKNNEELRGALNAGHRRGGQHLRCEGDNNDLRAFKTFAPVAIAGIGRLAGTLADRSLPISMRRRISSEEITHFRQDRPEALPELARKCARWAGDNFDALVAADQDMPEWLLNRAGDNWRPLFTVGDRAGGEWLERVRSVARFLSHGKEDETSIRVQLLADIRDTFENRRVDRLSSSEICEALAEKEESPWAEWGRPPKPITPVALARQLGHFGIKPKQMMGKGVQSNTRGYEKEAFRDAFTRYLDPQGAITLEIKESGAYSGNQAAIENSDIAVENPRKPPSTLKPSTIAPEQGNNADSWEMEL